MLVYRETGMLLIAVVCRSPSEGRKFVFFLLYRCSHVGLMLGVTGKRLNDIEGLATTYSNEHPLVA